MVAKKPAKNMSDTEAKTGMGKGGMNPKMGTKSPSGEEALKKQGTSGGARGAGSARPASSAKTKAPAKANKK